MSNNDMQGNDYVSVAKFRQEGVHDWQSEEGMTDATLICTALDAQTQATLALAYEQRTANLIALMASDIGIFTEEHLINAEYRPLMAEMKERLGLA